MSTKGVYTALSGAMAQNLRLETIANNLANVNTPGYKRDEQTFKEYLTAAEKYPEVIQVPRVPASVESFYDMQGTDKSFVDTAGTYTDFSQGSLKMTGNNMDLAIEGAGFFEVATPNGSRLSRNGSFTVDGLGQLVTKDGLPVLSEGAGDPSQRVIRVSSANVNVTRTGEVYDNGNMVGKLSVVQPDNILALQKEGSSLYTLRPNIATILNPVENPKIHQGAVEMSNVNIVKEMTDMIGATRVFESTQKAIQAYDAMNDKLVNVVPKTS